MDVKSWKDLKLSPYVHSAIEEMGFTEMTPVQVACIPFFLYKRKDVAVEAITGSGKTLAFLVPLLEMLLNRECLKKHEVGAIIISPTQELAIQISDVVKIFLKHIPCLTYMLLIGGEKILHFSKEFMDRGANIIIGTPGRLADLLTRKLDINFASYLKCLEVLILDEADRLLDLGFEKSLNTILGFLPKQRRTGLFSATQTKDVDDFVRAGLRNPISISVKEKPSAFGEILKTPCTLDNYFMITESDQKFNILLWFLKSRPDEKQLVFFATCASVNYYSTILAQLLDRMNIVSIHGKMKKNRHEICSHFSALNSGILLCTDVMARGMDFSGINWVIQYDLPSAASTFVHRIGRTARNGKSGSALVMLLHSEETFVNFLHINQKVVLKQMESPNVVDYIPKVKNMACKNRDIFEKGIRAFVSYVRFYTTHKCDYLIRLKDLDLGKLANGFALLKLPKMPELRNVELKCFKEVDVNFEDIPYRDKFKEKSRLLQLKQFKEIRVLENKKPHLPKKDQSWSKANKSRKKQKQNRSQKKRKHSAISAKDVEELARDARLLKKFKQKKITKDEFESLFHGNCENS